MVSEDVETNISARDNLPLVREGVFKLKYLVKFTKTQQFLSNLVDRSFLGNYIKHLRNLHLYESSGDFGTTLKKPNKNMEKSDFICNKLRKGRKCLLKHNQKGLSYGGF